MIRFQVIEREGADLHRTLLSAMRSGDLRTFHAKKRGRRVVHANPSITGWMKWSSQDGVILCEVTSPRKPGGEWHFFNAFLGRLAHRFADRIHAIHVQFPSGAEVPAAKARKRSAKARKRSAKARERRRKRRSRR